MSLNELALKFDSYGKNFEQIINEIAVAVLFEAKTKLMVRIFDEHRSTFGQSLGKYSTKEMWASPSQFYKGGFRPQGKGEHRLGLKRATYRKNDSYNGTTSTQAYKSNPNAAGHLEDRKTMYLANGYKELRAIQGLPVGEVNLQVKGDLKKFGIIPIVESNKYQLVFRTDYYMKIARGFEQRRNMAVFSASAEEKQELLEMAQNLLNQKTNEHFR